MSAAPSPLTAPALTHAATLAHPEPLSGPWRIQAATEDLVEPLAAMHVASWQAAYAHLLPADWLANLSVPRRAQAWRAILAEGRAQVWLALPAACEPGTEAPAASAASAGRVEGEVAPVLGFVSWGALRDEGAVAHEGEVHALYLAPSEWGSGLAHALMDSALSGLRSAGFRRVALWVLVGNARALGFYERRGFVAEPERRKSFELGGVSVDEVRMVRPLGEPA